MMTAVLITLTFVITGSLEGGQAFVFFIAALIYAMAFIFYAMFLTTFFSDSRLAT